MKQTISLIKGDEVRILATHTLRVEIEGDENLADPVIYNAVAARDREIARLLDLLREAEATIEENTRADADAIIDRMIERLQRKDDA